MFGYIPLRRVYEHRCAIQRALIALNHSDHQEDPGLLADRLYLRDRRRVGNLYGCRVIANKFIPALRSTVSNTDTE